MEKATKEIHSLRAEVGRLRDIERTFEALFQKSPIGIAYHRVVLDDDNRPVNYFFIDANDNYKELTGVDPRGKLVTEAFPGIENDPFDWIGTFGRVAVEGETVRFQQYLEPVDRWYDAVGYQSAPNHFVAAFLEITEAKRREAELSRYRNHLEELVAERTADLERAKENAEAANRAKTIFLANMSHELRTPLNAVLGYSEILRSRETDDRNRRYISAIRESGSALLTLINDVLDLSRIETERLEAVVVPVSIAELGAEIRSVFQGQAGSKDLDFAVTIDESVPPAVGTDPVRIRQILVNLVGNAVKFTATGSVRVVLASIPRSGETISLVITVTDTGKGIAIGDHERVFDTFVQATGQRPTDFEGAGLGLSITRRIIDELNGTIELDSEPGRGTTFKVKLPVVSSPEPVDAAIGGMDPEDLDLSDRTIAIVDDIEYNRDLLAAFLQPTGAQFIFASDGRAAIDLINRETPDLVLLDLKLPVLNGLEVLERVRANANTRDIPVVVVTASTMGEDEQLIRDAANAYLRKPVTRRMLTAEVARLLADDPSDPITESVEIPLPDSPPSAEFALEIRELVRDGDLAAAANLLSDAEERYGATQFTRRAMQLAESFEDEALLNFLEHT